MKIIIVDDDKKLQKLLSKYLQEYGFEIISLFRAHDAIRNIQEKNPDIVILDVVLPDINGLDLLRMIRQDMSVPVIMLSAKGEETDRIIGLEMGADDYLPKPFSSRELLARIKAILRRPKQDISPMASKKNKDTICVGNITLDCRRQALEKGSHQVQLTFTEFRLLEALMGNPHMVFSREELMSYARGNDYSVFDRSIDMHISRIRNKLDAFTNPGCQVKTAWGTGYMLVDKK